MGSEREFYWIDNEREVSSWFAAQKGSRYLAIDTEFERDRTYFPELQLIQLATSSSVALIDFLSLPSTVLLNKTISEYDTNIVLHAARQDL